MAGLFGPRPAAVGITEAADLLAFNTQPAHVYREWPEKQIVQIKAPAWRKRSEKNEQSGSRW